MAKLVDRANTAEVVMVDADIFHEFKTSVTANLAASGKELARLVRFFDGNGKEGLPARLARLEENLNKHTEQLSIIGKQIYELDIKLDRLGEKIDNLRIKPRATFKDTWESFGLGIRVGIVIGSILASFLGITGLIEIMKAILAGL